MIHHSVMQSAYPKPARCSETCPTVIVKNSPMNRCDVCKAAVKRQQLNRRNVRRKGTRSAE